MTKRRIIYRSRPKKTGAKKRQKVKSQKRRLIAMGVTKERLEKMNSTDVRKLLAETTKKKRKK